MRYDFSIEKNIHMYNHRITCRHEDKEYSCICESAPTKVPTIIFWPEDFGLNEVGTKALIDDLKVWCDQQSFGYIIHVGKGR